MAQRILRHSQIAMPMEVYAEANEEEVREAIGKLSDAMGGAPAERCESTNCKARRPHFGFPGLWRLLRSGLDVKEIVRSDREIVRLTANRQRVLPRLQWRQLNPQATSGSREAFVCSGDRVVGDAQHGDRLPSVCLRVDLLAIQHCGPLGSTHEVCAGRRISHEVHKGESKRHSVRDGARSLDLTAERSGQKPYVSRLVAPA
ncbi:hypothetical protein GCM10010094_28560 [Streptomyces flaveus]|uniref:Integrase n=1 Tax=Streptomyces flaveus TaxID=66370 RepID=A0A917QS53_9ACTN|nr:hypothetical protein GCM10010094_28560 [Streptomyces flaveus]